MKESILTGIFWQAALFLALSALVIPFLRYFKIPIALGYLFAGIALGPYALGGLTQDFPILKWISLTEGDHVKILAEIGIVLLLFVIGLELTPRRLWQMRNLVFGLGGTQVLISATVIGGIAYGWGNTIQVSALLGLGLALSSTAMVVQWLHEQKIFGNAVGRTSFSILLLQDLAIIPILLLLTIMSADIGENTASFLTISMTKMTLTVLALYFGGKILLKPIFTFANAHGGAEVFMALSLLIIVLSASIAASAGLSMALGAFIAGLLLADTQYRHEISTLIVPFKSMLIGIFFLSFGMGINLSFAAEKPIWLFASVLGLLGIKAIIIFALCKLWRLSNSIAAEASILLAQAGEFGLLIVGGALTAGLMEENVGQFMLLVIGFTMLLTPILAILARKAGEYFEQIEQNQDNYTPQTISDKNQHIVILGYGRIGQLVGNILNDEGLEIIGFEKNIQRLHHLEKQTIPVFLGDATKQTIFEAANIDKAASIVITLDDSNATKLIIKNLRTRNEHIPVYVRAHTIEDMEEYNNHANVFALAENQLISTKLAETLLQQEYMVDEAIEREQKA